MSDELKLINVSNAELFLMEMALSVYQRAETPPVTKELALKIGKALLEADSSSQHQIGLTEEDCWILREKIALSAQTGSEKAGLSLKKKLYELLLAYEDDRVLGDLPTVEVDEPSYEEAVRRKEAQDAGHDNHNTDADRAGSGTGETGQA